MEKNGFFKGAAAVLLMCVAAGCQAAYGLSAPPLPGPRLDYLLYVLQDRLGEYLFFIGAVYAGLLLLRKRRWPGAAAAFLLAVAWLALHLPVSIYLESLGIDSFAETKNFNLEEARFWFQTLRETVYPDLSLKKLVVYLAFSLLSFYLLQRLLAGQPFTRRRVAPIQLCIAGVLVGLAFWHTSSAALAVYFDNSEKFLITARNFDQPVPEVSVARSQPDLLVYIGESTSVMNMGVYGYPRPTTPRLSERVRTDPNLILFEHVFSTHVHTSRSLLEALSLGVDDAERFLPITQRKRVSIVDLLNQAGVASSLISNQGIGGAWDQASSVIFKNARKLFRQKPSASAAEATLVDKVWDHEFFGQQLDALESAGGSSRSAIFLHSYAGHGPYHGNIPAHFRRPVDGLLSQLKAAQIRGDASGPVESIEEYDAAVRYVDYSLDQAIGHVQQVARPLVLVYFSDHGDAVYQGLAHDSARFRHEMARVPFVIYFNDAARMENAGLYEKYRALARQKETATLAQLSATLMDLLGITLRDTAGNAGVVVTPVVGEKTVLPPLMVRDTADGTTFVNVNDFALPLPAAARRKLIDKTDEDTQAYAAVRAGRLSLAQACQTAPASLEEASRRIMVAGCSFAPFPGPGQEPGGPALQTPGSTARR